MAGYEAVAGVLGTMINMFNDEMARENSNNQNRINREWQANQNELDRTWQSKLQQEQFERQAAWQENMWNKQNEYNSPLAQINRLQAAGINPVASLYGGSAGSAAGNSQSLPNAPNPSTPGSHGASGSATPVSYSNNTMAGLFSSLAQLKDAESRAGVSKAEKNRIIALTKPEVEAQQAAAEKDRAIAAQQQEQSALTKISAGLLEKYGDDKNKAEIQERVWHSYALYAQGKYEEAQRELTLVQRDISRIEKQFKTDTYGQMVTNLKLLAEVYGSEAQRNIAQAELSRSEVDVNAEIRQLTFYKRLIEKNNWNIKDATFLAEVRATYDQLKQKGVDLGISEEELNKISTENKWINPMNFVEIVNRSLDALNKAKSLTR